MDEIKNMNNYVLDAQDSKSRNLDVKRISSIDFNGIVSQHHCLLDRVRL